MGIKGSEVNKGRNINTPVCLETCSHDEAVTKSPSPCVCECVCHLSLSAVPALWLHVREAEVCQAVVAAAVHRSIQTLES